MGATCPDDEVIGSLEECTAAAEALELLVESTITASEGSNNANTLAAGCSYVSSKSKLFWNPYEGGQGRSNDAPICVSVG